MFFNGVLVEAVTMNCLCRPSRILSARIILLDETEVHHEVKDDLLGQALLDVVFSRLNLIETAYFGIRYLDEENQTHWLDPSVRISRQLRGSKEPYGLYFGVKFYAADPCKLIEEITRYQFFLQVKQDILQGRLPVSFELAAELGAYIVQSELGDYDQRRHSNGYVSEFRLVSNQTRNLESRVAEIHKLLKGMSPSSAELNYLDKVKWHDMYGVDLHPVLGEDSVEYFLGLTPSGIVVLRNKTTVAHYYWPRIAKVYFKGRYFMLRVCDKNNEVSTYGFETPKKTACKHLWRCCVEHHAFFRLVRVTPMQPQQTPGELFSLGCRFRYSSCSGRTEKQAVKDALAHGRPPPHFTRTPSKRQPRRLTDDFLENKHNVESQIKNKQEIKSISIPQPAQSFESHYRSTFSIPTTLEIRPHGSNISNNNTVTPDSPRSTKSAPWARSQQRGLFGVATSPRSVRSATARNTSHLPSSSTHRFRSSSVESQSSNESRSGKRHRHRNRRTSDNESELSRGSGRSGRSHNSHRKHRRQRSRQRRNESGSDNESTRCRSYSGHRISSGSAELVDSGQQWREVLRRQAESTSAIHQASVTKSSLVAKNHANDSDSHSSHHHKGRRHRKNRSPSDSRSRIWSSELAKHLQFDLVDTTGMTEDQLREIPYTVVETHSVKRSAPSSLKVHKSANTKDRVDRIRGHEASTGLNGSIRSASTISSRDCERSSGLVRMMSSLSMGDFISPSGSSLSPLDSSGLRISHEHTDSGLGADQDYAYSSERSSDSTKYGTNKSSGASVTSGSNQKSTHLSHNHHSVSNRKPPVHPNRQQIKQTSTALVHNSNNRLINNTIFHNNHYTFSLSGIAGNGAGDNCNGGFLEPRPLSSASLHGEGVRLTTRGTKSDIGVPVRRPSAAGKQYLAQQHHGGAINVHTTKTPSIKADFSLTYLNTHNNQSCANNPNSAYRISGISTSDYLENYKAGVKCLYSANPGDSESNNSCDTVSHNIKQRRYVQNSISTSSTNVGPLLYLEENEPVSNRLTSNVEYRSIQNNTIVGEMSTEL